MAFSTWMIEAKEKRDAAAFNIPNAFIQTDKPLGKDREIVILKIEGPLARVLPN